MYHAHISNDLMHYTDTFINIIIKTFLQFKGMVQLIFCLVGATGPLQQHVVVEHFASHPHVY